MGNLQKVGIIDYGTGNIASIFKAINSIGAEPHLVSNKNQINNFKCFILPGVGHFGEAIKYLNENDLHEMISYILKLKVPILGICLGFQLLTESSEESLNYKGLGLFPFKTKRIKIKDTRIFKVPHLGWNSITRYDEDIKLLKGIKVEKQLFYYSNAYAIKYKKNTEIRKAFYKHENDLVAIAEYQNLFGVQFHPEKSRNQGLMLLKNFLDISDIRR